MPKNYGVTTRSYKSPMKSSASTPKPRKKPKKSMMGKKKGS